MRGKPFLAAAVAFLLVFLGGAAIAGVSGFSPQRVEAPQSAGSDDAPHKSTTSTSTTSTTGVKTGDDGRRTTDDELATTDVVVKLIAKTGYIARFARSRLAQLRLR